MEKRKLEGSERMNIPIQFQKEVFRFHPLYVNEIKLLPNGKKDSSCLKGITWDKTNYSAEEMREQFGENYTNYIVVLQNGQMVIDIESHAKDKEQIFKALDKLNTFTVETWSGGKHYYTNLDKEYDLGANEYLKGTEDEHIGELKFFGSVVYGVGTKVDGKEYKIINPALIQTVTPKQVEELLKPFTGKELKKEDEPKVEYSANEILRMVSFPDHQMCISLVMKLLEAHKQQSWGLHEVCNHVARYNTWGETYNPVTFRKYATPIVTKYKDKENPLRKEEKNKLELLTVKQLLEMEIPEDFLIKGLIRQGELIMLYSPAGTYKSMLAMHLGLSVANGTEFFELETRKANVLLLDNENPIPTIVNRLKKICLGMGFEEKDFPMNFLIRQGQLDNPEFIEKLKKLIEEENVQLIIIDTLRRFHSLEENSSKEMNQLYQIFDELREKTNASTLLLHHTNKGDETYRGSVDLKGMLDCQLKIKRQGTSNRFILENEKNRWGEIEPICIAVNPKEEDFITFTKIDEIQETSEDNYAQFKRARGFILTEVQKICLLDGQTFKRKDIIDELEGYNVDNEDKAISKRTLDQALKHLVKNKYLSKGQKNGEYIRLFSDKSKLNEWKGQFLSEIGDSNES